MDFNKLPGQSHSNSQNVDIYQALNTMRILIRITQYWLKCWIILTEWMTTANPNNKQLLKKCGRDRDMWDVQRSIGVTKFFNDFSNYSQSFTYLQKC